MKFRGEGHVWDPVKNRLAVSFGKEKEAEVEDERIIELLVKLGYDCDFHCVKEEPEEKELEEEVDFDSMYKKDLIEYAENNIDDLPSGFKRMTNDEMIEIIKGGESNER